MKPQESPVTRYIASSRDPMYDRQGLKTYADADPASGDEFAERIFAHAREGPLAISVNLSGGMVGIRDAEALRHPDAAYTMAMLKGLARLQHIARSRGDSFDAFLKFSHERIAPKKTSFAHDPEFPLEFIAPADPQDMLARLGDMGWPGRGSPRNVLDPVFWYWATLNTVRRGCIPLAYSGDGPRPYYNIMALITDPTKPGFDEWALHTIRRSRALIREATGLDAGVLTQAKDKHYWRRPEFNEPGRDGWYWAHQCRVLPEWAEAQTGLWSAPYPMISRPDNTTRADLATLLHRAGVPALHRIWRPRGIRYEDFFERDFDHPVYYIP